MVRKALLLLSLGGLLFAASCGQTGDPPPRMIGGAAGSLAPVTMAGQTFDKSLMASAQPLPELDGKAGAAETPAAEEKPAEEPKAADEAEASADQPEEPAAEPKPAEPKTAPEPAQPKKEEAAVKPEPKRDEVDEAYSGPGMLHAR